MFALINVGERSGIGLCDVFSTWKEYEYQNPELIESVDPDRITITLEIELCDRARGNVANDVANVANDVANSRELRDLEKTIFDFIFSHTNASTKDIAEAVGVTARTVQRSIKELERCKVIKKTGKRNNIEWIILR